MLSGIKLDGPNIMNFGEILTTCSFALSEGSVYERLRRHPAVEFDPELAHATLIYDAKSADILAQIHREYLDVGQRYGLPMLALTDTWRGNRERIHRSLFRNRRVNQDNASFMTKIRRDYGLAAQPIFIGGQIGPRGDAYRPQEALSATDAATFHSFQIEALAETNVDLLFASTLAELMWASHLRYGTRFMGGCCGTDTRHIECLARKH